MLWVMHAPDSDWLIPDWPAPLNVRALFTTRSGGVSGGTYAGLNLGLHVGDDSAVVEANRIRLRDALGVRAVFMNQVHGIHAAELHAASPDGLEADAAWTRSPGLACTVMVADCLPVLFATQQVGVWRPHTPAGADYSGKTGEVFWSRPSKRWTSRGRRRQRVRTGWPGWGPVSAPCV